MESIEDVKCSLLLFCATFGVGSLSMGGVFASSGAILASVTIYVFAACNLHASMALSKCLQVMPIQVRTFGDLGFYVAGNSGRYIILISEALSCLLTPIAFLVLGGTQLLPNIFKSVFPSLSPTHWIILMMIGVLPIVYIPTLKETAWLCLLGSVAALLTDIIAVSVNMTSVPGDIRQTEVQAVNSLSTFGTITFAFGTAILIPPIQRQHSNPQNMVACVSFTVLLITCLYISIGTMTYIQFGCTSPLNILEKLPTGPWQKLANASMLIHIMIAYPVLLSPTLFVFERHIFKKDTDIEVLNKTILNSSSPAHTYTSETFRSSQPNRAYSNAPPIVNDNVALLTSEPSDLLSHSHSLYTDSVQKKKIYSPTAASLYVAQNDTSDHLEEAELNVEFTRKEAMCRILLRTVVIFLQGIVAILLQDSFLDILTFIGATTVTIPCLIMPCICYLLVFQDIEITTWMERMDRFMTYFVIFISVVLGVFSSMHAIGNINATFQSSSGNAQFVNGLQHYPFCPIGEQN